MSEFVPGDRVFHRGLLRNGTVVTDFSGALAIVAWDDGFQATTVSTNYLTPLGETMTHDFTHQHSDKGNQSHLDVHLVPAGLRLTLTTHTAISGWFDPEQAAAIAHAILIKAYESAPSGVARAILALEEHAQVVAIDAEKKQKEESTWALAKKLYNTHRTMAHDTWGALEPSGRDHWFGIAEAAVKHLDGVSNE